MNEEIKKHFSAMGKKGGKANKHQDKGGKAAWAKLSAEERSRITSERAKKAWDTKRAKAKKKGNN